MINQPSPNFAFLATRDPRLVALGTQASLEALLGELADGVLTDAG